MKNFFIFGIIPILLFSCQKDQDTYLKDYLSDNGINLIIKGEIGENELNETFQMLLFDNYMSHSYVDTTGFYSEYYFYIKRYSKDYQSNVVFNIGLDQSFELVNGSCTYYLTIIKDLNKILIISHGSNLPDLSINNLNYDHTTGNLKFDYNFNLNNGSDQIYSIEGNANVKVYQY